MDDELSQLMDEQEEARQQAIDDDLLYRMINEDEFREDIYGNDDKDTHATNNNAGCAGIFLALLSLSFVLVVYIV
ncbi:MAG: hypothetical protein LBU44_05790 [Mediterranea sp.]|jgi:hypothetical protein|nr:hypothetical protein [Mediterranea sp.]